MINCFYLCVNRSCFNLVVHWIIKAVSLTKHHFVPHILYYSFVTGRKFVSQPLCFFSQAWITEKTFALSTVTKHTFECVYKYVCYVLFLSAYWRASPLQSLFIYLHIAFYFFKCRRDKYVSLGDAAKTSVRNNELHSTVETPQSSSVPFPMKTHRKTYKNRFVVRQLRHFWSFLNVGIVTWFVTLLRLKS